MESLQAGPHVEVPSEEFATWLEQQAAEQQEFDYTRHGTVNMLVFLVVHGGLMELALLAKNGHEHYLPE